MSAEVEWRPMAGVERGVETEVNGRLVQVHQPEPDGWTRWRVVGDDRHGGTPQAEPLRTEDG